MCSFCFPKHATEYSRRQVLHSIELQRRLSAPRQLNIASENQPPAVYEVRPLNFAQWSDLVRLGGKLFTLKALTGSLFAAAGCRPQTHVRVHRWGDTPSHLASFLSKLRPPLRYYPPQQYPPPLLPVEQDPSSVGRSKMPSSSYEHHNSRAMTFTVEEVEQSRMPRNSRYNHFDPTP